VRQEIVTAETRIAIGRSHMPEARRCKAHLSTGRRFYHPVRRKGSAGSKDRAQAFDIRRGQVGARVGSHGSFDRITDTPQLDFVTFPDRICSPRVTIFWLTNASWINDRCLADLLQKRPMGVPEKQKIRPLDIPQERPRKGRSTKIDTRR
jgi:hypothetical protein